MRALRFRTHLVLLTACAITPVLALATVLLMREMDERRRVALDTLGQQAQSLATAVDREIEGTIRALEAAALAISAEDLATPDRLWPRLSAMRARNGQWHNLVLVAPDGQIALNTLVPAGAPLPGVVPEARTADAVGARAAVSNPFTGNVASVPLIAVSVPVSAVEGSPWVLSAGIRTHSFEAAIVEALPPSALAAIIGGDGRFVAHSSTPQGDRTAAPAPPDAAAFARTSSAGDTALIETRRVTGERAISAVRRLQVAPWTAAVGVPATVLERAAWAPLWRLAGFGAAALAAALLAAAALGRRLGRRVGALAQAAEAAGQGSTLVVPGGVFEVDRVAAALSDAAATVRAREVEVRRISEERLRLAVEGAGLSTWDVNLASGEAAWSESQFRTLGYPPAPSGRATIAMWRARLHPDDVRLVEDALARARRDAVPYNVEYRIRRADDGSERWLAAYGRVLRGPNGGSAQLTGVSLDVTERRRAEDALRRSEARLRLAHQIARTGSFEWRVSEPHATITPEYAEISGLPPGTATDTHADALRRIHPEDRAGHEAVVQSVLTGDTQSYETEFRIVRASDGVTRRLASRAEVQRDEEGRLVSLVGVVRDVTEQRAAKDELEALNVELEKRVQAEVAAREAAQARAAHAERMQALGQLAGGIAHDFNNVLQAVQGGAALIERRPGDTEGVRRLARMVIEAAGRGVTVTRRLLAFARRDELRAEPVEVGPLLGGLCEVLSHTLGAAIACRHETAAGTPMLLADKGQLETVLVNLAANARDAMPGGGTLTVTAAPEVVVGSGSPVNGPGPGRYVRISVADTGSGMDEATLARVAEPFFTTKPEGKGTGLGLSMARGFAEQSGGALSIESVPGRGTTVHLWLPSARDAAPRAQPAAQGDAGESGRPANAPSLRVLLVDDNDVVRESIAGELEAAGFALVCASDATEALALLAAGEAIDVLVTDLSMPGSSGLALIHEAQARRPNLPAILLTGYAGDGAALAVGGALTGSFSLLRKPIPGPQLAERIEAVLASRRDGSKADAAAPVHSAEPRAATGLQRKAPGP